MIYAINYDLKKPGQNYEALYEAVKSCGDWWHYLGSTWLIDTTLPAKGIWDRLVPHVDQNDFFFICGVTKEHQGWLPQDAWNWINARIAKMAA